jgi:hypothetical protein
MKAKVEADVNFTRFRAPNTSMLDSTYETSSKLNAQPQVAMAIIANSSKP